MRPAPLIALMCLAEVLGMAANATFLALIPTFQSEWALSNTEAGWIGGIYYGGYVAAVPVLVTLTDSRDARRIYLGSTALGAVAALGFALLASGLWSAVLFRLLGGIGLAGTYMVGLKILTDRLDGAWQSRGVAWYTAHFSIGHSFSILLAGEVNDLAGWQWAYGVAALATLGAFLLIWLAVPRQPREPRSGKVQGHPLDLRPALRNRRALAYNIGYACHVWELFGYRAWLVAFLVFVLARQGLDSFVGLTATQAATLLFMLGLPASVLGNEAAMRYGRGRVISVAMLASAAIACGLGFSAALPLGLLAVLLCGYGLLVMADSAALTAGAVEEALPGRKGATMAVHALLGFSTGALAPLAFGAVLDLAGGGQTTLSWGLAFASLACVVAVGPLFLRRLLDAGDPAR